MPRQRPAAAQMIDFRIADPRATSLCCRIRFPVIYGSTTRSPGVKLSNDFSRACVGARVSGPRPQRLERRAIGFNWIPRLLLVSIRVVGVWSWTYCCNLPIVVGSTPNVRATSTSVSPLARRSIASCRWCCVIFRGRPNRTPRACARFRPSSVRAFIRWRSNVAKPARTVTNSSPCGVEVSHHGSCSDLNLAPRSAMACRILSRSRVDRASRSRRVTISRSSRSSRFRTLPSSARSVRAPDDRPISAGHCVNAAARLPILRFPILRDSRSRPADNGPRPCGPHSALGRLANDQAAGAFSSMTLFLAAIVVLAAGLRGTLFLLFRDAHRGTKGPKRFLLSNWK